MANNYEQPGDILQHTASSDIEAGDGVVVGSRFGVALVDIPNGKTGSVQMEGVFRLPKVSGALSQGAKVYWNGEKITATSSDNTEAGYVFEGVASGDGDVLVKLLG